VASETLYADAGEEEDEVADEPSGERA
jgi:hypothetical protein